MPEVIENYAPQIVVKPISFQAWAAWGLIFLVALIWVALIVAAPIAEAFSWTGVSQLIYRFFGHLCHQMEWRSFHLESHPLAVCARCFGFYGGFLLGIIIHPLIRSLSDTRPLSRIWLFLALIPMAIDWSLTFFGIWENTHYSRLLTGGIAGATCAFFIIPALVEISFYLSQRFRRRG